MVLAALPDLWPADAFHPSRSLSVATSTTTQEMTMTSAGAEDSK